MCLVFMGVDVSRDCSRNKPTKMVLVGPKKKAKVRKSEIKNER